MNCSLETAAASASPSPPMKALNLVLTLLFHSRRALGPRALGARAREPRPSSAAHLAPRDRGSATLEREERVLWLALRRSWRRRRDALVVVKPETVIGWHRTAFPCYSTSISRSLPRIRPGRRVLQKWGTFLRNHRDVLAAMDVLHGADGNVSSRHRLVPDPPVVQPREPIT